MKIYKDRPGDKKSDGCYDGRWFVAWGHAIDDSRPLRSSCLLSALDFGRTAPRTGKWFFLCSANALGNGIIDRVQAAVMMVQNKGDVASSRPLSLEKRHHDDIDNLL